MKWFNNRTITATAIFAAFVIPAEAGKKFDISDNQWISLGAGIRTSYTSTEDAAPDGSRDNDFDIESIRLYVNGQAYDNIYFTFNTEEIDNTVDVLDAIVRFELDPAFNIWLGRFLTPADRIELNGPYYSLTWNQYTLPLFPSDQGGDAGRLGRDDGVTIWGKSGRFIYAVGIFDGLNGFSNTGDDPLFAGRISYQFLALENNPGYYTSSTYFGSLGNVLTLAASFQSQKGGSGNAVESGDFSGYALDFLSETVLDSGGVVTIEGEYKNFNADFTLGDDAPTTDPSCADSFCLFDGNAYFLSAAYLFPKKIGPGKFQPYVRHVENDPSDGSKSNLTEFGVNYILKGHDAHINLNYNNGDANASGYALPDDVNSFSIGVQLQI